MFWHVDWNEFRMRYIVQRMPPFVTKLGHWPVYVVLRLSLTIAYLLSVTQFCTLQSLFTFFHHTPEHSLKGWVGVTILMFYPFQMFLKQTTSKFLERQQLSTHDHQMLMFQTYFPCGMVHSLHSCNPIDMSVLQGYLTTCSDCPSFYIKSLCSHFFSFAVFDSDWIDSIWLNSRIQLKPNLSCVVTLHSFRFVIVMIFAPDTFLRHLNISFSTGFYSYSLSDIGLIVNLNDKSFNITL